MAVGASSHRPCSGPPRIAEKHAPGANRGRPLVTRDQARHRALGDVGRSHLKRHRSAGAKPALAGRMVDGDRAGYDGEPLARLEHPGELALWRAAELAAEHGLQRRVLALVA